MTTLQSAFRNGVDFLEASGIKNAYFETRFLLLNTIGLEPSHLYSYPERLLTRAETSALKCALVQRAGGRPSAYIANKCEFYGLEFHVDPRVLIPRPETELVVEKALDYAATHRGELSIADIGTGSGIIVITMARNLPMARLFAVDISHDALDVARLNAVKLGVAGRITFLHGNLTEPLSEPVDLITANLPYIPDEDVENLPVEISSHEPRIALAGGKDGLMLIRRLIEASAGKIRPGGCIVMEIGAGQAKTVMAMLNTFLPRSAKSELFKDPNGLDRIIKLVLN